MQNFVIASATSQLFAGVSIGEILMLLVCALSVVIFIIWLFFHSGPLALAGCPERTNEVPFWLPFLSLGVWMLLAEAAMQGVDRFIQSPAWKVEFLSYLFNSVIQLVLIGAMLVVGWKYFSRRLKGFGLDFRTLKRDVPMSVVNFIAILPLVWLGIYVVDLVGGLLDPEFEIGANPGLTALTENPQMTMRVLMLGFIIVVVPVFEELLFRGLLQSMARSYLNSAWGAIVFSSVVFAMMHPQLHWVAIFVLSLALGYSYERSGSLWRPILIHVFFNTTNVLAALLMGT